MTGKEWKKKEIHQLWNLTGIGIEQRGLFTKHPMDDRINSFSMLFLIRCECDAIVYPISFHGNPSQAVVPNFSRECGL